MGDDLKTIAGLNGYTVTKLAKKIRRSRNTIYRAWKRPTQYQPTHAELSKVLIRREVGE